MNGRKAQTLMGELIMWGMSFLIFVFAAPLLLEAVGLSVQTGVIAFVVRLTPWVLLLLIASRFIKIVVSGGRTA